MERFPNLWNVTAETSEKRNPTQIASTRGTYRNIYNILKKQGFNGTILDASSGLGIGTQIGRGEFGFNVEDIEPYPSESYKPMYTDYSTLNKKYDAIISSAVLNVLPQDQRDALVVKMGELLKEGGKMYITTRGSDVNSLAKTGKNIHLGSMEWIETARGSYQKGFTQNELQAYLRDALGSNFSVELSNAQNGGRFNNNTSIVVTKNAETRYQLKESDESDRAALAKALKKTTVSEEEKAILKDYLKQVEKFDRDAETLGNVNDELRKLSFGKGKRDTARINELRKQKADLERKITAFDKNLLKLERAKPIRDVISAERKRLEKRHKAELKKVSAEQRQAVNEAVERTKQHAKDIADRRRERKLGSDARTRLLKVARRLSKMKTTEANREVIKEALGDLDLISKGITGKTIQKLTELNEWYQDQRLHNDDFIADKHIEGALARLTSTKIADMTIGDVIDLTDVLLNIENEIRTANKLIAEEERRNLYELGIQAIDGINRARGIKGFQSLRTLHEMFIENTLSPMRAVNRIVGYDENNPLLKATERLADGQRDMFDFERRANAKFLPFTSDKKFMKSFSGKNADEIEIMGVDKDTKEMTTVKITPAMRVSLYLHSLNDQNLKHIANGGIRIPYINDYKRGNYDLAYTKGTTLILSPSQVRAITNQMTAKEKAYAKAVHDYFNGMSQEEINRVSEQLKGYSLAGVENYFPINTDPNFTNRDFESLKRDGTIEGMGFLKERVNAANAILMRDVNLVLDQSIRMTAKYVGLAIPVRNFNKLWNARTTTEDGSSIKDSVDTKWGKSAQSYIEKMLTDLQNPSHERDVFGKALGKLRSNYAKGVLTLNGSVALKQAASYPTAAAVIGWRPLALAMKNFGKVDLDLIAKYTPLQWYRSQGFSTQELAELAKAGKSLPKVLNWIQGIDLVTTRKLWKASEYYVRIHNKSLKVGTDEFYKAVADVYNRVIEETQPNYTTMQRPQLLRSNNSLLQTLVMFKTQPFQNFNILYDAFGNLNAKVREYHSNKNADTKAALQKAMGKAARATTSQIMSLAVFAGMTALWNALRGKKKKYLGDDEEDNLLNYLDGIGKDMLSGAAGMIPFGTEVWELASSYVFGEKYYGLEPVSISMVNDTIEAVEKFSNDVASLWQEDKNYRPWDYALALDTLGGSVGKLFGLPWENVTNLFKAFFYQAVTAYPRTTGNKGDELFGEYVYTLYTSNPEKSNSPFIDILFKAFKQDRNGYKKILNHMIASGLFEEDKINSALESRLKKEEGAESLKDLSTRFLGKDQDAYDRAIKDLKGSSVYNSASEENRKKAESEVYLSFSSDKEKERLDKKGISGTDYAMWKLALGAVDTPNSNGKMGTYTKQEKSDALKMLGISGKEAEKYL